MCVDVITESVPLPALTDALDRLHARPSEIIFGVSGGDGGSDWNGDGADPVLQYPVAPSSSLLPFSLSLVAKVAFTADVFITVTTLDRPALDTCALASSARLERRLRVAVEEVLGADREVGCRLASKVRLYWPASAVLVDMRTVSETRTISASCSGPSPPGIIAVYRTPTCASRRPRFLRSAAQHMSMGLG